MADLPQVKVPQVSCCAIRVSILDLDGTPTVDASASYVSDCLSKLTITPNYEAGSEIKEDNACGNTYVDFLAEASLTRVNIDIDLMAPDPNLLEVLASAGRRLNGAFGVGWGLPPLGKVTGQCAIELWAQRINNGKLDPTFPYAHWILPYVKNVQFGAHEFSNTVGHTLLTAEGYENANFLDGPQNDWPTVSDRAAMWIPTATIPTNDTGAFVAVAAS